MSIHLHKIGKRKCHICNEIFPLNKDYFYTSKGKTRKGFRANCINCSKFRVKKYNIDYRLKFVEYCGFECKNCGIKNSNKSFFDVDHIKPIKKAIRQSTDRVVYKEQYHLFQLLCPNCHRLKTIEDNKKISYTQLC